MGRRQQDTIAESVDEVFAVQPADKRLTRQGEDRPWHALPRPRVSSRTSRAPPVSRVVYINRAGKESGLLQGGLTTVTDPAQPLLNRSFAASFDAAWPV